MAKLVRGVVKAALLAKAWQLVRRQMARPENRRRVEELVGRATARISEGSRNPVARDARR